MTEVPERPRLKPWCRVAVLEDALAVEYGECVLRFGGRAATALLPVVLPLLDGTRTVAELACALGEPLLPALEHALVRLAENGLLVDGPELSGPNVRVRTAVFHAAESGEGIDEHEAERRIRAGRVSVAGGGPLALEVARVLRLSGVRGVELTGLGTVPSEPGLLLVAPEPHELNELVEWNRVCLAAAVAAWLQILPFNGRLAFVGPFYVPGETACFECFRLRRAANSGFAEEFWALEQARVRWGSTPALDALIAGAAASLALRWLVDRDPLLPGRFFSIGFADALEVRGHVVYRVPRCHACSGLADTAAPLPWADAA